MPDARRGKHARDGTKYGKSRAKRANVFTHHAQRISMAAAIRVTAGTTVRIMKQCPLRAYRAAACSTPPKWAAGVRWVCASKDVGCGFICVCLCMLVCFVQQQQTFWL